MLLFVKFDGLIFSENFVVLIFMLFLWVSKICVFYILMFCIWSVLIKLLMCYNLFLKFFICDKFFNLVIIRVM